MKADTLIIICSGVILGFGAMFYLSRRLQMHYDVSYAKDIVAELKANLHLPEVTDKELLEHFEGGNVLMATHPVKPSDPSDDPADRGLRFFNGPANTRYWPYYHYTFPYQYTEGGAWPPNMYSRLYNWQPGFETSGWSYWMRPGMSYARWPRNRWVKNNGSFYFINNGNDRKNDYV